jgi:hypothetical protein
VAASEFPSYHWRVTAYSEKHSSSKLDLRALGTRRWPRTTQGRHVAYWFGWWLVLICSLFVCLVAGADLFREKNIVGQLMVAGLFWEKCIDG